MLSRLKIGVRIYLLIALAAFGMFVCAGIGLWALRAQMFEDRRVQLTSLMDVVLNNARDTMNRSGGAQTEPGRAAFFDTIRGAKFSDSPANYFFVYDYDGVALWHPDPSRRGRNLSDFVYPDGVRMVTKYIEIGKSAPLGGFIEYEGPDSRGNLAPKLALLRDAPELQVVVGVSAHIRDTNAAFLARLYVMAWPFALALLATGLAGAVVSRSIDGPLSNAVRKIKRLANGELGIAPANPDEKSELGEVDKSLDVLRANAIEGQALQEKVREQDELLMQRQRESEERWRQFVDEVPASMLMLDCNMVHLACSRRWLELSGQKDGGIGCHHYDIFTEVPEHWKEAHRRADRDYVEKMVEGMVALGQEYEIQWRLMQPEGKPHRWLLSRGSPIIGADEAPDRYVGVVIDITQQKLMEEALRQSKERQSFLLAISDALRCTGDPDEAIAIASKMLGQKLDASQVVFCKIEASGASTYVTHNWHDGVLPDTFAPPRIGAFDASFLEDLVNGQTITVADACSDPRTRKLEARALLERGSVAAFIVVPFVKDRRPAGALGVHKREPYSWKEDEVTLVQDVAQRTWEVVERAGISQALRESKERLKFALEAAEVGSWEMLLERRIYTASDRAQSFFDLSPGVQPSYEDIIARVHPDDREAVDKALQHTAETGQPLKIEFRRLRPDNSIRWLEARAERRLISGKHVMGGLVQDITARVEQKEALERASAAKSEFLANMSHELRTPMHAVLGYCEICTTAVRECGAPCIEKYLKNITTSGKRLLNLLNDLLNLAKMEAGRMEFKFERADMKEVVEHTLMELDPLIKAKNLQIQVRLGGNTDALFDRTHLVQVLINLVSNAIKFSNAGSKIGIDLTEDPLGGAEREVRCSVIDEGPGIPDDELKAVFDKFIQSKKTKTGAGGTGLGLAICDHIIKAHGGRIWAENAKPRGAAFTFVIPRGDADGRAIGVAEAQK